MRKHPVPALVLTLLLAASIPHSPRATTVKPVAQSCPVCQSDFVALALTSYSYFGSRERDFGNMPFARFRSLTTCPHCLHTALDYHFESGTPALKPVLETLPAKLDGPLAKKLAGEDYFLQLLIAEACAAERNAGLKEQAELALQRYYAAKRVDDAALLATERARAGASLRIALESGAFTPADAVLFTYLRGELLRRAGSETQALQLFERARALARAAPRLPAGKDIPEWPEWIAVWAEEQTLRIHYAKKGVAELDALCATPGPRRNVALLTLAERIEPSAWAVLFKHVATPERLLELDDAASLTREALQRHPPFFRWGAAQFKAAQEPGAAPELNRFRNRFAHLFDDARNTWTPKRVHAKELAAALRAQTGDAAQSVVFPEGWDEQTTLRHLPLAMQDGETAASAFFLRWAEAIDDARCDDFSYEIKTCLRALPPHPARATVLAPALRNDPDAGPYGRRVMNALLRLLAGDAPSSERLLMLLRDDAARSAHWELAACACIIADNPLLKAELLPRMKGDRHSHVRYAFAETYAHFGSNADIPALAAFIATLPLRRAKADPDTEDADRVFAANLHERYALEQMLLRLKLRKLVTDCGGK